MIFSLILLLFALDVSAQQRLISGKVFQAGTGTTLSGVEIKIVGSDSSVKSNHSGRYQISVPDSIKNIRFDENSGIRIKEIKVKSENNIDIYLEELSVQDLFALSFDDLMRITVTTAGKKEEEVADIPASVVVISREDIQRFGYATLTEIIENVPGFYKIDDWVSQGENFGVRGFWSNQFNRNIIFLVDGMLQREDVFGWTVMSSIGVPVEAIDRIEFIRGPMSVLYGSGAFFGVINIITNNSKTDQRNNIASVSIGNEGTTKTAIRYTNRQEDFQYAINASLSSTDGANMPFSDLASSVVTFNGDYVTDAMTGGHLGEQKKHLNFDGVFRDFQAKFSYTETENNWIGYVPPIADRPSKADLTFIRMSFGYKKELSSAVTIDGKLSYYYGEPFTIEATWFPGNTLGYERDHYKTLNAELNAFLTYNTFNLTMGFNHNSINSSFINVDAPPLGYPNLFLRNLDPINTYELFAQLQYRVSDRLQVVGGARLDLQTGYRIQEQYNKGLDNFYEIKHKYDEGSVQFIPRMAIIYNTKSQNILKLMYGKAINRPSFFENIQLGYHPILLPQEIQTFEINYSAKLSSSFTTNLSLYYNILDKLIVRSISWNSETEIYQSFQSNSGEKVSTGAELLLGYIANKFKFEFALNWQKTVNRNFEDVKVGYSPNLLGNLKSSYQLTDKISVATTVNYVSEMESMWDTSPVNVKDINSPSKGRIGNKVDGYFNLSANLRINDIFMKGFYINTHGGNLLNTEIRYPTTTYSTWTSRGTIGDRFNFLVTVGYEFGTK